MYLWNRSTPNRDGDLDSDIVWHEYGHGLTWRMIGNMSGPFAGAIGEGMGDTLAIYTNQDDRVGEYSNNNTVGIRRYRYTNYPLTYGDLTGSSVHNDGEIYAATMWRLLRDLGPASGRTPGFPVRHRHRRHELHAGAAGLRGHARRDPRAASDSQGEDCLVWEAFAYFGIGEGANGVESCNIFRCTATVTESFNVPSVCSGGGSNTAPTVTISSPSTGASFVEGASITFTGSATDTQDGSLTGSLTWTSSRDGVIGSGATFQRSNLSVGTHTVTASVTDSGALTGSASVTVNVTQAGGGPTIALAIAGRKVKGVNHVDLTWSGATTVVDISRNNVKIVSATTNDGTHTDNTNTKGGGHSYTYRVCEAGTATCSPDRTIVF